MRDSKFSLVPREFGRTAYHLMETLQMGLIPIYIYSDIPWLPYIEVYKNIGYMTTLDGLPTLVQRLKKLSMEKILEKELQIRSLYESLLTAPATLSQLQNFLMGRDNDFVCQKLPHSKN